MAPAQVARHQRKAETRSARQRRSQTGVWQPAGYSPPARSSFPQGRGPAGRGPGEAPPGGRGRREAGLCELNPAVQTLRKPAQRIGRSRCAFLPRLFPAEARPCAALFSGRGGQTNRAARPAVRQLGAGQSVWNGVPGSPSLHARQLRTGVSSFMSWVLGAGRDEVVVQG